MIGSYLLLVTLSLLSLFSPSHAAMDLTNYVPTFTQNFSQLTELSVSAVGPNTTWISHTPYFGDWNNFEEPSGPYRPFYLNTTSKTLTIRTQMINKTLYSGLLSSVDPQGVGFSQQYGYFEMTAQLPKGPGTWPAFWLMDTTGLRYPELNHHEIDILEQYGDAIGILRSTLHYWDSTNSSNTWGQGWAFSACSMTEGQHSYGLDLQPDIMTVYYDRQMIFQMPNQMPGGRGRYDRPMYVMVDMAYGGGGSGNNISYIDDHPQDLVITSINVWQGKNGSFNANDYRSAPALYYSPTQLTLTSPHNVSTVDTALLCASDGNLVITKHGQTLWSTKLTPQDCGTTGCQCAFQNDGNFVLKDGKGTVYWASNTWGNNGGSLMLSGDFPYLRIFDDDCRVLWTTQNQTHRHIRLGKKI